ncbi:MAG: hypothetical protein JWM11_3911 [Planctomycetaceae bacterium]|nr:hypothetical protein [Planctomycetaceae bacterium]
MSKFRRLINFSRRWGALISVIGAWLVFFSWGVGNSYKEQHASLKAQIQFAQQNQTTALQLNLVSGELRILKNQIHFLEGIPNPTLKAIPREQEIVWSNIDAGDLYLNALLDIENYCSSRLILADSLTSHPQPVANLNVLQKKIKKSTESLTTMRSICYEKAGQHSRTPDNPSLKETEAVVQKYHDSAMATESQSDRYRKDANASGAAIDKAAEEETNIAKSWGSFWSYIAGGLFVCGSVIGLTGQVFDKGFPKEVPLA